MAGRNLDDGTGDPRRGSADNGRISRTCSRRAGFGGTTAQIATLAGATVATTVDQLLDFSGAPADVEPAFLTDRHRRLGEGVPAPAWWLDRMATTTTPLQEKLTFFWHGHFATANYKVTDMRLMYLQNALFRQMAAGNFRDLVQQMSLQPAMLIWLDNDPNSKGHPNENFARELMELFTLGVASTRRPTSWRRHERGPGHNTLDGDRTQYHFYPNRHDTRLKTFMGVTQNWDGPDIIDFLLRRRRHTQLDRGAVTSPRRCGRSSPTRTRTTPIVNALADAFLAADLSIADARAHDLHTTRSSSRPRRSRASCDRRSSGSSRACARSDLTADDANPQWWMEDMGQQLFEPPNVSGWRPNEYWLTTSRVVARANCRRYIIWQNDVGNTLSAITGMTVPNAVQCRVRPLGVDNPSAHTRTNLEAWLTAQRAAAERVGQLVAHQLADARDAEPEAIRALPDQRRTQPVRTQPVHRGGGSSRAPRSARVPSPSARTSRRSRRSRRRRSPTTRAFSSRSISAAATTASTWSCRSATPTTTRCGRRSSSPRAIPVGGGLGLHPSLVKLKARFDQDKVAIVRGVGYNPADLSHFSSTDIWTHGWGGSGMPTTGWLGRYLDSLPNTAHESLYGVVIARQRESPPRRRGRRTPRRCPSASATRSASTAPTHPTRACTTRCRVSMGTGASGLGTLGDLYDTSEMRAHAAAQRIRPAYGFTAAEHQHRAAARARRAPHQRQPRHPGHRHRSSTASTRTPISRAGTRRCSWGGSTRAIDTFYKALVDRAGGARSR